MFSCRPATTESEKESVYRLRYDVYIREMGMTNRYADHQQHTIIDPRDNDGVLFASYDRDTLVGTALGTGLSSNALGEFHQLYQVDQMSAEERARSFLFSMLIFLPEYRGSHAVIQCVRTVMLHFYVRGYHFCLLHCYPKDAAARKDNRKTTNYFVTMSDYCQRYGFKPHGHGTTEDIDDVQIMQCDLRDRDYLAACHSPLLTVLHPRETHE